MERIGFAGFGEVAYHYALGLLSEGVPACRLLAYYPRDRSGTASLERAQAAGVAVVRDPAELARGADVILSVATPAAALEVGRAILPFLGGQHLYADLNSAGARVKRELAALAAQRGVPFADVAILGALPVYRHRVRMAASGSGAAQLAQCLGRLGTPVQVLGPEAGAAAVFKLVRSVYMKGQALLLLEMLAAARAAGIEEAVVLDLKDAMDQMGFVPMLERLTTGTVAHARRRVGELDFVLETMADLGVRPRLLPAVREAMAAVAALAAGQPRNWQEAVAAAAPVWRP